MSISILSLTNLQYAQQVFDTLHKGFFHAQRIYADWLQNGKIDLDASWIEPQAKFLVKQIVELTDFSLPNRSENKEEGSLIKFLLQFSDGLESESVLIPMQFGNTLCISSQIGCRMGCAFCETGKMGLLRNLSVAEIISQVFCARHVFKKNIRNIVFMGMGEPLDNFENVSQAIRVLTCPQGLAFGPSRITVSTSGVVDNIYKMIEHFDPAINLAVSVNAPTDLIRQKIMPVNKKWNMATLKQAMLDYCLHPRREILAEYVLIDKVNDSLDNADDLSAYLKGLKVKVNLIPYNPQTRDRFAPPSEEVREAFLLRMRQNGYQTLLRTTKGQTVRAACGQLGNKSQRNKLLLINT